MTGLTSTAGTMPELGPREVSAQEPATAVSDGAPGIAAEAHPPIHYGAGFLRIFSFSIVFLLLLPFFASLPMMIGMRASAGLLGANWGILVLAAVFAAVMFIILVEIVFSIRTQVHLGRDKVRMTLPAGRGPTPLIRYRHYEFPYEDVHTVETRREIYGGWLAPVLLKGARVTLKDGTVVPLGYVSEADGDPILPYPEIAGHIAERARLPLIDRGNVWRTVHKKMLGIKDTGTQSDIADPQLIERLNRSHSSFLLFLIGAFLILMMIGVVEDFASGTPIGQTASML